MFGPEIPPPTSRESNAHTEWQLLRHTADGWVTNGSAHGPTWLPEAISGAVIWAAWVIFGQPRHARQGGRRMPTPRPRM
jgi:hypothetical protein